MKLIQKSTAVYNLNHNVNHILIMVNASYFQIRARSKSWIKLGLNWCKIVLVFHKEQQKRKKDKAGEFMILDEQTDEVCCHGYCDRVCKDFLITTNFLRSIEYTQVVNLTNN